MRATATAATLVALLAVAPACGGGGEEETTGATAGSSTTDAGMAVDGRPCGEGRPAVLVDVMTLIPSLDDFIAWQRDATREPVVVTRAPETLQRYLDQGYDVVYLGPFPPNVTVGETPASEALNGWLGRHGFPLGEGTHLQLTWDTAAEPNLAMFVTQTLFELRDTGVRPVYGYANNEDDARALLNNGIPPDRVFTRAGAAGALGTYPLPDGDWSTHYQDRVEGLPEACRL